MKLSFLLKKYAISSQNSGITSYPSVHNLLHANQLIKGFNASVGTMNCGCHRAARFRFFSFRFGFNF